MEIIRGKQASFIDSPAFADCASRYQFVHLDLGTGDGAFVRHLGRANPEWFVIGVDASRENLRENSRRSPDNALFVIANACALPFELTGMASRITVNFPWGSLLNGLLENELGLLGGLRAIARPGADLEVRLNAGALAESGWTLNDGADRVHCVLSAYGFEPRSRVLLTARDLRAYPTTWAKRLAFGRDPRAVLLRGARKAAIIAGAVDAKRDGKVA